uniref:Uncharacterized protein n=1 Tax=Theileria annulata TaxID=5874 RepID=A0A3B0MMQ8_THEAN
MAVPKNKRSKSKVNQRTNIIFFDQLCGNWRRRREWFYRRLAIEKFLPSTCEPKFSLNRPVLFPGFWSTYFLHIIITIIIRLVIMRIFKGFVKVLPDFQTKHFNYRQFRYLGQAPQGKNIENFESAWEEGKKLFYRQSLSYNEFAKRVECLRLFLFWGLVTGLAFDIAFRPPKSRYWFTWNLRERFSKPKPTSLPPLQDDNMTDATREYNKICNF